MKIDRLIENTTEKDGVKKWKVVVGIVVALGLVFAGFYWYVFVYADVDLYLQENKEIINLYDFYDEKYGEDTRAVYFIGSSIVAESIYPTRINNILSQDGYSNVTVYSAFLSGDTPLMRSVQIQNIIDSKPSLIVYGLMPRDIGANDWCDEYFSLVLPRLDLRFDSLYLYTPEQLQSFSPIINPKDIKKYIENAKYAKSVANVGSVTPHATLDYSTDPLGIEYRKFISLKLNNENNTISNVNNPNSRYRIESEINGYWTQNKEALMYIISTLTENDIPVIILNMPINPLLSEKISEESYANYYALFDKTGVDYYDLDGILSSDFFFDEVHMTFDGALEFAPIMADIIIRELS